MLYIRDNAKINPQQDDYHQFGFTLDGFISNDERLVGLLRSYWQINKDMEMKLHSNDHY